MKGIFYQCAFSICSPFLLSIINLCPICVNGQSSAPSGIFKSEVYENVRLTSDIPYGSNFNHFTNQNETLLLDTYEPDSIVDYRRPLIIYAHGGGFTTGDKTTDKAGTLGDYFAKRGYLLASIDYRLAIDNPNDTIDNYEEVYQATQDAMAAIRYFKRYGDNYCVDTSAIFMIGTSAGASMCLTTAYWDEFEAAKFFNTADFGPLDNSSGNEGYSSKLTGIIVCWGGVPDTTWLRGETTPNQLFHGTDDPSVPYFSGFNPEGLYIFGGYSIHEASLRYGIESYLHPFVGAGHGVGQNSEEFDTLEQMSNDFIIAHIAENEGILHCDSALIPVEQFSVIVSPNPSDGHLYFTVPNVTSTYIANLQLCNMAGETIRNNYISLEKNTSYQLDYSSLANGIYFLKISDPTGVHTYKLFLRTQ
jgi:poly(3-hydroxybutyrate) depolymerase